MSFGVNVVSLDEASLAELMSIAYRFLTFFLYFVALVFTGRIKKMRIVDWVFWPLFLFMGFMLIILLAPFDISMRIWNLYIGLSFYLSHVHKDRLVYGSRRQDLRWYGTWTVIVFAGPAVFFAADLVMQSHVFGEMLASLMLTIFFYGLFLFLMKPLILRRDRKRGFLPEE